MSHEILVAGFHRSGTSMIAQLLHAAGLHVGDDLLGAMPSNPYGHFEDREVVSLHESILRDNGYGWQVGEPFIPRIYPDRWATAQRLIERRRTRHAIWGFKDPRVCLFVGMWKHLLPAAKILVVYRSAVDAVYSLERRHAQQMFAGEGPRDTHLRFWRESDLALRMWIVHNRNLLAACATYPDDVVVVSFEVVAEGFPLVDHLAARWNIPLRQVPTHEVFDPRVTTSRPYPLHVSEPSLIDAAMKVWRDLKALERSTALSPEVVYAT